MKYKQTYYGLCYVGTAILHLNMNSHRQPLKETLSTRVHLS